MLKVSVIVITAAHSSVYASINVVMYLCVGFCSLVLYESVIPMLHLL